MFRIKLRTTKKPEPEPMSSRARWVQRAIWDAPRVGGGTGFVISGDTLVMAHASKDGDDLSVYDCIILRRGSAERPKLDDNTARKNAKDSSWLGWSERMRVRRARDEKKPAKKKGKA